MNTAPPVNLNGAILADEQEQHDVVSGMATLRDDSSAGAPSQRRGSRSSFTAKCNKYNTAHFPMSGPSFSSLASSGSTIVLSRNANYYIEDEDEESPSGEVLMSDAEYECVVPLKGGDGEGSDEFRGRGGENKEGGVTSGNPNTSYTYDIGNTRRVPRTNSYYRRAGMTPRMDDMHFLANAPSFSSVATTATNVTDARLSSMASITNSSFASRNGLSAAAVSMTSTSNLRSDPRFALMSSQSAARIGRTTSTTSNAASFSSSLGPTSNSSLSGGVARPRGTSNIFLQQDDTDYQNLLTSIVTSNSIAIAPANAGQQRTEAPIAGTAAIAGNAPTDLRRSTSNLNSNTRRLSDEGTHRLGTSSKNVSRASGMRRSNSSAVSILRRGRYSSGILASVREDQEEGHKGIHDNNHNASFNNNNSVKFTAPTIHLIGEEAASLQQQDQHLDDKEQTIENAGDFDNDEQIPACILSAFAGGTPESESLTRRPTCSACTSLSSQDDSRKIGGAIDADTNKKKAKKVINKSGNNEERPTPDDGGEKSEIQQVPREVTAVGRYYEDDELDEYLFAGIQSLQTDGDDGNIPNTETGGSSSRRSSGLASSQRCNSAGSLSSLSTLESRSSLASQNLVR